MRLKIKNEIRHLKLIKKLLVLSLPRILLPGAERVNDVNKTPKCPAPRDLQPLLKRFD